MHAYCDTKQGSNVQYAILYHVPHLPHHPATISHLPVSCRLSCKGRNGSGKGASSPDFSLIAGLLL